MNSASPYAYYMSCPSHILWIDRYNYIWRRIQAMKLLVMHLSLTSYCFIALWCRYYHLSVQTLLHGIR
jgi:hypothetical protein